MKLAEVIRAAYYGMVLVIMEIAKLYRLELNDSMYSTLGLQRTETNTWTKRLDNNEGRLSTNIDNLGRHRKHTRWKGPRDRTSPEAQDTFKEDKEKTEVMKPTNHWPTQRETLAYHAVAMQASKGKHLNEVNFDTDFKPSRDRQSSISVHIARTIRLCGTIKKIRMHNQIIWRRENQIANDRHSQMEVARR